MKPGTEITIKALESGFDVLWSGDENLVAEPVAGCTTMECVFAFIRSRMEPESENPGASLREQLKGRVLVKGSAEWLAQTAPAAEPAWKRAKLDDLVSVSGIQYRLIGTRKDQWIGIHAGGMIAYIHREAVTDIVPPPAEDDAA